MKTIKFQIFIEIISAFIFYSSFSIYPQEKEFGRIKIKNLLEIGNDESKSVEYLFQDPRFIFTDSDDNIYVAEEMDMSVRVFKKDGTFLRRIGRRGKGPGEFLDFTLAYINDKDEIIVFDQFNARISFFSKAGKFLNQQNYFFNELSWPRGIKQLKSGKYVLSYKIEGENTLLHIFGADLKKRMYRLDEDNLMGYSDDIIEATYFSLFSNSFTVDKEDNIYFAKHLYNGKIYVFSFHNSRWKLSKIINGLVYKDPPYTRFSSNEKTLNDNNKKRFDFVAVNSGESIVANIHNESLGLYKLSTGELIHFTIIEKKKSKLLGAELYDSKMFFKKYYVLQKKEKIKDEAVNFDIKILWKDRADNFYIVDYSKFPTIKKVKFNFED